MARLGIEARVAPGDFNEIRVPPTELNHVTLRKLEARFTASPMTVPERNRFYKQELFVRDAWVVGKIIETLRFGAGHRIAVAADKADLEAVPLRSLKYHVFLAPIKIRITS